LRFYFSAVNEMSIKSGLLRDWIRELAMDMEEEIWFTRGLQLIDNSMKKIAAEKLEQERKNGER